MTLPPDGPDLPPDGMPPVAYALTPRTCDAYALVLEAVGIRFTVLREGTLYAFRVGAADAARSAKAEARLRQKAAALLAEEAPPQDPNLTRLLGLPPLPSGKEPPST